jgi:CheY-like chemotaxis protein
MIVDDDIDDIEIFIDATHVVDPSLICMSAQNGLEAINIINATKVKPDCIFVDLNMPKLNGKQFTKEIRKNPSYSHIKIIIYSTSKLDRDEKEVKQLGANEFITKPTSHDELCNSIARILEIEYHSNS